jgi:hypothetical protein
MTAWKFEYRAFMDADPVDVRKKIDDQMPVDGLTKIVQNEQDMYCVAGATEIAVRVRGSDVKMKGPVKAVDDLVDEMSDERAYLPVNSDTIAAALGFKKEKDPKYLKTAEKLRVWMKEKGSKTSDVAKTMTKYTGKGVEIEVSQVVIDGDTKWTVCVASDDAKKVRAAVEFYGLKGLGKKMHYAEAVRQYGK